MVEIFGEHMRATHQDFAAFGELELPARRDRTTFPGPRKRPALPRNDRAGFLGLAVDLDQIHAPDLPERGRFRRQRRAARNDQLDLVESELLE